MIKANELRIGNWVANTYGDFVKLLDVERSFEFHVNPIPLTPKIWRKFWADSGIDYGDSQLDYMARMEDFSIKGHQFYKADFKYVHQLQNLYFALTGEELKLEL